LNLTYNYTTISDCFYTCNYKKLLLPIEDEKYNIELAKLRKFTKTRTGTKTKFKDRSKPVVSMDTLDKNTKKAPDMAAFIHYQKMKKSKSLSAYAGEFEDEILNSTENKKAADNAAFANLEHSSKTTAKPNNGAFLITTTRQLNRPVEEIMDEDGYDQKCQKARVKYDFKANSEKELNLKRGQLVWVYGDVDSNWYHGEFLGSAICQKGIFPKKFVEIIDGSEQINKFRVIEYGSAEVLYDIKGRNDKEISCSKGQTIILIRKVNENWWEVRSPQAYPKERKGLIPDNYISVTKTPLTSEGREIVADQSEKIEKSKPHKKPKSTADFAEEVSKTAKKFVALPVKFDDLDCLNETLCRDVKTEKKIISKKAIEFF